MSLAADGIWKAGVWATTVWASGVWYEAGALSIAVPATSGIKKKGRRQARHINWNNDPVRLPVITKAETQELARLIRSAIEAEDQQQAAYLNALFAQELGIAQFEQSQAIARQQYLQDSARLAQHKQAIEAEDMQIVAQVVHGILNDESTAIQELAYNLVSRE